MIKPVAVKFLTIVDSHFGTIQKIAFVLTIFPQVTMLLFNREDFIINPVYLIICSFIGYVFLFYCWVVALRRKKDVNPYDDGNTYYYSRTYKIGATIVIAGATVGLIWLLNVVNKSSPALTINPENCHAEISDKSWFNAGAFITVTNNDGSNNVKVAKLIPADNLISASRFNGLDCAMELFLKPDTSIPLTIAAIEVEVTGFLPLPKYSKNKPDERHITQDSLFVLTLYTTTEHPPEKQDVKMVIGNIIKA